VRITLRTTCSEDFVFGGLAQAFDLAGITNAVAAPFLRIFREGVGVRNAGAPWV
jgi:hypothetical protein